MRTLRVVMSGVAVIVWPGVLGYALVKHLNQTIKQAIVDAWNLPSSLPSSSPSWHRHRY